MLLRLPARCHGFIREYTLLYSASRFPVVQIMSGEDISLIQDLISILIIGIGFLLLACLVILRRSAARLRILIQGRLGRGTVNCISHKLDLVFLLREDQFTLAEGIFGRFGFATWAQVTAISTLCNRLLS